MRLATMFFAFGFLVTLSFGAALNVTLDDMPPEIVMKIMESSDQPTHVMSVNSHYSRFPIPCNHYPALLRSALRRYNNARTAQHNDAVIQKCINVIKQNSKLIKCFGKEALEVSLQENATEIVYSFLESKGVLDNITPRAALYAVYYNYKEIVDHLVSSGYFNSAQALLTVNDTQSWKEEKSSLSLWSDFGNYKTFPDQTGMYYVASVLSRNERLVDALLTTNVSFFPRTIRHAAQLGMTETLVNLWGKFSSSIELSDLNLAALTAVKANQFSTALFLNSLLPIGARTTTSGFIMRVSKGADMIALFQGLRDPIDYELMLFMLAESVLESQQDIFHTAAWESVLGHSHETLGIEWPVPTLDRLLRTVLTFDGNNKDNLARHFDLANLIVKIHPLDATIATQLATFDKDTLVEFVDETHYLADKLYSWSKRMEFLSQLHIPDYDPSAILSDALLTSLQYFTHRRRGPTRFWRLQDIYIHHFYSDVLKLRPDARNPEILKVAAQYTKDASIITDLVNYGFKIRQEHLAHIEEGLETSMKDILRSAIE
jgi:hypothetical protein